MRRTLARFTLTAAATVGLAATASVHALGLGEIDVSSNLNQRFVASIPLTDISAEDLETVTVSLAPNESFERAGIERADYLSSLEFEIKNDRSRPRVVVTSSQIAREPVLDLLVQARWRGGKIQRDYTILLDPAVVAVRSAAPASAPVPAPIIAASPEVTRPAVPVGSEFYEPAVEAKPGPKSATRSPSKTPLKSEPATIHQDPAFDSATGTYGPVIAKETLWSIASKLRPDASVTMDQMLLALSEANPIAIQRGTTVSEGATLRVPSAERIQSTSPAAAKARLAALRANGAPAISKPASPATKPSAATANGSQPSRPLDAVLSAGASTAPVVATPPAEVKPQTATTPAEVATTAANASTAATAGTAAAQTPSNPSTSQDGTPASTPVSPTAAAAPAPPAAVAKSPQPEAAESGWLYVYGLLALLALFAGGLLVWSRRREASADRKRGTQLKPSDTTSVSLTAGGAGAVGRLGDKAPLPQTTAARNGAATSPQVSAPVQAAAAAGVAAQQSTMILDPQAMAALNSAGRSSAVTNGSENFDKTAQVQVDTLQINLSDDDPLSEADFHLAYGLYDEAIALLKNAAQKQPQRTDIQLKLAETYFAAGRPMEFHEIAEDLKPQLAAADWSKLAIMGSQICPGVALFQGGESDAGLDADFDLAFDEPAAPSSVAASNTVEFSLADAAAATMPPLATTLTPLGQLISDADFGDDQVVSKSSQPESLPQGSVPPVGLDDDASIDFMLGQSLTPLGAGLRVPDPADLSFDLRSSSLNFDVPKLDYGQPAAVGSPPARDANISQAANHLSLSLQDLEVSITPRQSEAESMDEDLNTKLDLARAYVEMGDNDMARSLLVEVQQQGGDRHQQEAASLLQRLPA